MKRLALALSILLALPAVADPMKTYTKPVVLTPTVLYDHINTLENKANVQDAKIEKLINVATKANQRVQTLEKKLQQLDDQHTAEIDALGKGLQATRSQVSGIVVQLRGKIAKKADK